VSTQPTIRRPRHTRLAYVGATGGVALTSWIACFAAYIAHINGLPTREVGSMLLGLAVTSTLVTGQLWHSYSTEKASASNAAALGEAIGQLASEMEQVSHKVGRIDPMAIYTALAEDILLDKK
jgi:hypothetical protein